MLTNKQAIRRLEHIPLHPKIAPKSADAIYEARDMAIKAMQDRPNARRIYGNECSRCHYKVTEYDNYCSMCGAYLRQRRLYE